LLRTWPPKPRIRDTARRFWKWLQAWHELAEKEDQPLPLQAHAQAQQPAQQQQQPQPDEDKDE